MLQYTTVNQCLHFSTVLGAVIKCKQYSGITVESWTHVKSVKITLNYLQCIVVWNPASLFFFIDSKQDSMKIIME